MFCSRLASFSSSNCAWNVRSRLNACTTAMPETDSAICAVTAAMRLRVSTSATCDVRWNQRVKTSAGGTIAKTTSPSRQSAISSAITAAGSSTTFATSVGMPCERTSRDRVDVARQARDDPARLLLREVAQREPGQVVEEVAAQPEHHPLAEPGEAADQHGLEHPAARRDAEVDRDDHRQVVLVARGDALVDRAAHEQPAAGLRGRVAGGDEHERDRQQLAGPRGTARAASRGDHLVAEELRRTRRRRAAAARGVPDSTIRPSLSTTARSASSTVESRCVATSTVRPASAGRSRLTRRRSVSVSTAESGSSRTTTRAPVTSARASATRWRWPPERLIPRSPISVS